MKKVTESEQVKISCPKAVVNYIQNMGGIDIFDQKIGYYEVGQPSKKLVEISFFILY
jgi:hypothetical protein